MCVPFIKLECGHEKGGRDLKVGVEDIYNVTCKQMKDLFGVKKGTSQK